MRAALLLVLLAALLLGACGPARRSEPAAGAFVPASESERRGEVVFDRHCNKCHVGGEAALGPGINDKPLPVALMKTQVRIGIGAMPGFPEREISARELDDLMDYLKALRRHKGVTDPAEAPAAPSGAAPESR
jgi:mono/diheme cytochrome c family protein